MATYKLKPFYGARVCFSGFPEEEMRHMCEVLEQQGGEPTDIDDPTCTHVVSNVNMTTLTVPRFAFYSQIFTVKKKKISKYLF